MESALYILTGYTAVGKTRLSLEWAKANDAEIISCDSLLFYKCMDIGTAKPSMEELAEVRHHLINVVPASKQYSISEYLKAAKEAVTDIHKRGKRVLVVGGSGFYLNAFFAPVVDNLKLDPKERNRIEKIFRKQALETSVDMLRKLNPDGLGGLDIHNPRRVLKAWLRCAASGKTLAELKADFENRPGEFDSYEKRVLVLSRPREELEARIELRVVGMIAEGLVDEVKQLLSMGVRNNPSAASSIGYRETIACLQGELPESQLADTISLNTRKLVKKQRTWFKKYLPSEAVMDVSSIEQLPNQWHVVRSRNGGDSKAHEGL